MFNPLLASLSPFELFLYQTPSLWLLIWSLVYIGDYGLTILSAGLYQRVKHVIEYEGSFELTPQFQEDINALRLISPRFILALMLSWMLLVIGWLAFTIWLDIAVFFAMLYGAVMVREGVIYLRHMRNLSLFRALDKGSGGLEGHLRYERWLIYQSSAKELWNAGILFLLLAVWVNSFFLLGGTISLVVTGLQHWRLGKIAEGIGAKGP